MPDDVKRALDEAIERILASKSPKKLVVAGPGAGKTTLFRKLLDGSASSADHRLVLTFINNLKADLEGSKLERSRDFPARSRQCFGSLKECGTIGPRPPPSA